MVSHGAAFAESARIALVCAACVVSGCSEGPPSHAGSGTAGTGESRDGATLKGTGGGSSGETSTGGTPDSAPPATAGVDDSGPPYRSALLIRPDDLATGVDALVRPNVKASGGFPGAPLPPSWPPVLDLYAEPSGARVSAIAVEDGGAASAEIVPHTPLSNGWYLFTVRGWSGGFAGVDPLQGGRGPIKLPDGAYGVRFHVGSYPLLLVAGICASDRKNLFPKVVLRFSELVNPPSNLPVRVVADGSQATCALNGALSAPTDFIELACDPPISVTAAVTIEIAEGLFSTSNTPVQDVTGATSMTVSIPAAQDSDVCRLWLETRAPVAQTIRDAGPG
jgi:hypothetical protein